MSTAQKVFIYARKSTDTEDRQVFSIDHQLKELRDLACRLGVEVVAELIELRTAKVPDRPVFKEMLNRIKQGHASCILAWHPDRLARNAVDGGQIIHLIDTSVIADLKFAQFWFEPTPQGMLMLSIAFGMSKYYVDSLSQGIKRNYIHRVEEGYWPRRPPIGYRFDHATRTVIPDPVRAPLVRAAFELYATGNYSIEQLTRAMNDRGLTSPPTKKRSAKYLYRSQYYTLLLNPFYTGMLRFRGELFEGKHEPIVSPRLFDKCHLILTQKGKARPAGAKPFLYRGLFTCAECGCAITNEVQKGHVYLHCTKRKGSCSQPYLREEDASRQITSIIQKVALPQDAADALIRDLEAKQVLERSAVADDIKRLQVTIAKNSEKQRRLTDAFVDGILSPEEFRQAKEKLLRDKQKHQEKLTFLQTHPKSPLEPAIRFVRGSTKAWQAAVAGDVVEQRDFLRKVGSNLRIKNGCIHWEPRGPWKYIKESHFSSVSGMGAPDTGAPSGASALKAPSRSAVVGAVRAPQEDFPSFFTVTNEWE